MTIESFPFDPAAATGLAATAAIAILGPLVAAAVVWRRTGASPLYALFGATCFFVSQIVLRLPWQIPLALFVAERAKADPALGVAFGVFSACTAGLFEEVGRYVAFRWMVPNERSARAGWMFGLGHGGFESIVLVGGPVALNLALWLVLAAGVNPGLPPTALDPLRTQLGSLTAALALAGGVERISAIAGHVGFTLLVMQAFVRGDPRTGRGALRWVALATLLHAAVDLTPLAAPHLGVWGTEGLIAGLAAAVLGFATFAASRAPR